MEGYRVKEYGMPVKRYCQALDLKNNPELIAEYRKMHSREEAWPEIRAGIRSVGMLEMEIYIVGCKLFMIVETPLDFDWDSAMKRLAQFQTGRVGRLCGTFSGMRAGKQFCREMAADGAYVLFV